MQKLNTNPYKGTRDFYPEDKRVQNYIFSVMRRIAEKFGYEEYDAPIIEEKTLFAAKSGEELVNEQSYSFIDRGNREVMIRPEMTPSLARMVARKRNELIYPIRWYSIPNLWRYENPQRGRVREHWQLNVDMYGIDSVAADFEIISVVTNIMTAYGATNNMYRLRVNNRRLMNTLFTDILKLDEAGSYRISKAIDKKAKITNEKFENLVGEFLDSDKIKILQNFLSIKTPEDIAEFDQSLKNSQGLKELSELFLFVKNAKLDNIVIFDPEIMRGIDYYTGTVFEVFDLNKENSRALFGGGRYDNLLSEFGEKDLSGVGFGMGDVTIRDFLITHNLLPELHNSNIVYVTVFDKNYQNESARIAQILRDANIKVILESENLKLDKQLKYADKKGYALAIILGSEEIEKNEVVVKNLKEHKERKVKKSELVKIAREELAK